MSKTGRDRFIFHEGHIAAAVYVAQAPEANFDSKMAGSLGLVSGFSFCPDKGLDVFCDAGMAVTNDESTAIAVRKYLKR